MARRKQPKAAAPSETRAAPRNNTSAVIPQLPLYLQLQRIGGSQTPQQVSAILIEGDTGRIRRLVDLVHECRQKDGDLHTAMQSRELAIKGLEWDCIAPEKSTAKDKKVAAAAKAALEQANGLADLFAHLVGEGVQFSNGAAETMWGYDKRRGLLVPKRWEHISSRRFLYRQEDGRLVFSDYGGGPEFELSDVPNKFIQYRPRVNGDVPAREGLGRLLIWPCLFRNWTLRDWLALGEIGWKPTREGIYDDQAQQEDIDNLQAMLEQMSSTGFGLHARKVEVKTEYPKNQLSTTGSVHGEFYDKMGEWITKAVLGQTLTTSQGNRGSQALGNVHNEVRHDIRDSDAMGIAETFREQVIAPFVRMNFGPRVAVPLFFFLTEDPLDLVSFADSISKLRQAGMPIPQSYVNDRTGIPKQSGNEPMLGDTKEDDDDGKPPSKPDGNDSDPKPDDKPDPEAEDDTGD